MSIEIWDPHFHIWDISKNTKSGHDASQLFTLKDRPIYSWREYEHDIIAVSQLEIVNRLFSDTCMAPIKEQIAIKEKADLVAANCFRWYVPRAN